MNLLALDHALSKLGLVLFLGVTLAGSHHAQHTRPSAPPGSNKTQAPPVHLYVYGRLPLPCATWSNDLTVHVGEPVQLQVGPDFLESVVNYSLPGGTPASITGELGSVIHTVHWDAEGVYQVTVASGASTGENSVTVTVLPSVLVTVSATITADNSYVFGYGTATEMTCAAAPVVNQLASQIFSCDGPESYTVQVATHEYLYIAAWSDDAVSQGLLGQFRINGTGTPYRYTGNGQWQVYATGIDYDSTAPSCAQINEQIAIANASAGESGMSSVGWVGKNGGCYLEEGFLAIGERNLMGNGSQTCDDAFSFVCQTRIKMGARWMWYNPNVSCPFRPGADHLEFLIFRLPVKVLVKQ